MPTVRSLLPDTPITTLDGYLAAGGGEGLRAARALGPEGTLDEIEASGLRGRGGAGFPTATKWRSVATTPSRLRYAVANGAEGEPATFKDRLLMRRDPYRVVEGLAIAALAVGRARRTSRPSGRFGRESAALRRAVVEMSAAGLLGDLTVNLVEPAPTSTCSARRRPCSRSSRASSRCPACSRRTCTACSPPRRRRAGRRSRPARAHGSRATRRSSTTSRRWRRRRTSWPRAPSGSARSGTADRPGRSWPPSSATSCARASPRSRWARRSRVIDASAAGRARAARFKAVLLGRVERRRCTAATRRAAELRGPGRRGSGWAPPASSSTTTPTCWSVARRCSRFLAVESCGQCPPCKLGSLAITRHLGEIADGRGRDEDLGEIAAVLRTVTDANRCYLGTEEQTLVSSVLRAFPEDVAAHLEGTAPTGPADPGAARARHRRRRRGHLRRAPSAQAPRLDVRVAVDGIRPAARAPGRRRPPRPPRRRPPRAPAPRCAARSPGTWCGRARSRRRSRRRAVAPRC